MIPTLLTAVLGIFAASILRGFTGFGFGLAAVPLLSLALPPAQVVPLVVVLQAIVGVAGVGSAWPLCDWRAVRRLTPGLIVGIPLGLIVLTGFEPNQVRLVIGVMIAASVVVLWRGLRLPPNPSPGITLGVGLVSGVMSGLSSMGGPPIVVYLLALAHSAARVRATSIIYFLLSALLSLVPMTWRGLIGQEVLIWAVACVPVLFGGSWIGTWGFRHAQPHHHRTTALVVLTLLSAVLIARAVAV
ncbi:MAG: sulfite exporter TauE/SafE family protein [Acetobacteraceae bacterium]|nr:sulfite exporter TauE/SafE family protein [Acetobacteraceae bacterium]